MSLRYKRVLLLHRPGLSAAPLEGHGVGDVGAPDNVGALPPSPRGPLLGRLRQCTA